MLLRVISLLVAYVPGTGFFADGLGAQNLRLSYCYPDPARIEEGVRRLSGIIEAELELIDTFGVNGTSGPSTGSSHTHSPKSDLV